MNRVNLKFLNQSITLNCDDPEKVTNLSDKLNKKIEEFNTAKHINDTKLIYIAALSIQNSLDETNHKLESLQEQFSTELLDGNKVLIDTLNYVSEYIENLAEKLEK